MKKLKVMIYQLSYRFDKLESKLEQPAEGRKSTKSVDTSSDFQRGKFASIFARGQGRRTQISCWKCGQVWSYCQMMQE